MFKRPSDRLAYWDWLESALPAFNGSNTMIVGDLNVDPMRSRSVGRASRCSHRCDRLADSIPRDWLEFYGETGADVSHRSRNRQSNASDRLLGVRYRRRRMPVCRTGRVLGSRRTRRRCARAGSPCRRVDNMSTNAVSAVSARVALATTTSHAQANQLQLPLTPALSLRERGQLGRPNSYVHLAASESPCETGGDASSVTVSVFRNARIRSRYTSGRSR